MSEKENKELELKEDTQEKASEKKKKSDKIDKGNFGYIDYTKKWKSILGFGSLIMVLVIYFTGVITYGHNKSLFTVIAIVSMLPTAKFLVGFIIIARFKSSAKNIYEKLIPYCNNKKYAYINEEWIYEIPEEEIAPQEECTATMLSDLIFTFGDHIMNVDYIIINRGHVFAYSDDKKLDKEYTKDYVKKLLDNHCNYKSYKFYTEENVFLKDVLNDINANQDNHKKVLMNDMAMARKLLPYSI